MSDESDCRLRDVIVLEQFSLQVQASNVKERDFRFQKDQQLPFWPRICPNDLGASNYQISEGTHNHVISNYLDPNGYITDKLYQVTYGATTQDVRDSYGNMEICTHI